ncbi:hypothetical protein DXG01_000498 [Tephrocybe rancida]|nr:hypothetical protein DXG01_000498 [Tephrocybe rancida]
MSSRSRRDALSNLESLILAQAVWENGASSWPAVAKTLSSHALISRPKSFFTAQASQAMYSNLMQQAGLERTEDCDLIHSSINHKLAEKYYIARVKEIRQLIVEEEEKFKSILSEIEAIRAGNFDAEITAKITGIPFNPAPAPETKAAETPALDELFEGSDLTGVSVTPASSSQSQVNTAGLESTVSKQMHLEPVVVEGSSQAPITLNGNSTGPSLVEAGTPIRDVEKGQEESDDVEQPSSFIVPLESALSSATPKVGQGLEEEEELMVVDPGNTRQEEEEEEDEEEVADEMDVEAPQNVEEIVEPKEAAHEEVDVEELPSETSGEPVDISQEESTLVQEEAHESSETAPEKTEGEAEAEVVVDDGESSGEEPLHVSRRSTRRRRSTLSPAQPLQTRGKARKQQPQSPINNREESETEPTEETEDPQDEASKAEMDRDVSPAPSRRPQGKRKTSFAEGIDSPRDKKRTRDDSEPVDEDEAGPSHGRGRRPGIRTEGHKRFQAVISMLHSQISQHRNGNIFHNPIKNSEAPDYREIVKRPVDLKTIKMRVKDGSITNSQEYQRDIMLMFANAMMYNRPGSDVHTMAEDMMVESEGHIMAFRQTEGLVNVRGARHA